MKKCPNCDFKCRDDARKCVCGFDFDLIEKPGVGLAIGATHARARSGGKTEVVITDVQMPFSSMVMFMVKWALASIPAVIILTAVWFLAIAFVTLFFGALGVMISR